jgi:ketosteroid isomerase-like protein
MSRETNTANAFLSFLSEDAVLFRQGAATNGRQLWEGTKPDSTLLNWWPVVAEISASGDIGYTTGPYQYFANRNDKTPVDNGYYSTIWKKQKNGEWKINIDLGVSLDQIKDLPSALSLVEPLEKQRSVKQKVSSIDAELNQRLNNTLKSIDPKFLARNFRIHRGSIDPAIGTTSSVENSEANRRFRFEHAGGEESISRDLAYTYGNVTSSDNDGEHKLNYLRVWKNEKGEWRIVLDVVTTG